MGADEHAISYGDRREIGAYWDIGDCVRSGIADGPPMAVCAVDGDETGDIAMPSDCDNAALVIDLGENSNPRSCPDLRLSIDEHQLVKPP